VLVVLGWVNTIPFHLPFGPVVIDLNVPLPLLTSSLLLSPFPHDLSRITSILLCI
jgi:energy-converting hydrogenase Eha subunit E